LTNLSPGVPAAVPPAAQGALVDFLQNGLTDPRVAAAVPPFDRPTLVFVPEPSGLWPLAAGLATLLALNRRKGRLVR
jgi:hypothetical protein